MASGCCVGALLTLLTFTDAFKSQCHIIYIFYVSFSRSLFPSLAQEVYQVWCDQCMGCELRFINVFS
jgi:hypothetical protein